LVLYAWHIITIAAFSAIATLLIVWLFIQRSRHGRSKEALRTSEERYLLALAGSTDGLWDWDLLLDTVFYSDRFKEILGYSAEEFPDRIDSFRSRLHPRHRAHLGGDPTPSSGTCPIQSRIPPADKIGRLPMVSGRWPGHLEQ
jgi:PAS domain-containing protein